VSPHLLGGDHFPHFNLKNIRLHTQAPGVRVSEIHEYSSAQRYGLSPRKCRKCLIFARHHYTDCCA
jgi:hypothetical protein